MIGNNTNHISWSILDVKEQKDHDLSVVRNLIDSSLNRFRCFLIVNELRESKRSDETDVAGIDK